MQETKTQVAIVGGGPVGLVLALFLDFHGAKCTIFNTEPESRRHPKGNGQNARTMELYRRLVPLGRLGTAEESANAIDFLCSERASFINGQSLFLDGGVSVVWQEEIAKSFSGL